MRKSKQILTALVLTALVLSALCIPASAITESEVEAQVAASGREAVTGSVLLWFLCAVAFLKVSQKIDSFMATLGVNVGRTGGSMLAEAMIAMRTVTMVMGGGRGGGAGRTGSAAGSSAGRAGAAGMAGFFKGGLVGMASRHVTSSAVKSAVTNTSSFHTAQSQVQQASAVQTTAEANVNSAVHTDGDTAIYAPQAGNAAGGTEGGVHHTEHSSQAAHAVHTASSSERAHTLRAQADAGARPTLGGMVFSKSLAAGGSFANSVIGSVARGEVSGSITGDMAAQSLSSYMGCSSPGGGEQESPVYSDVEIGRGRITGVETAAGSSEGLSFAMYHVDQYTAPTGEYTKVVSADGTQWYKQYAVDAVERKPYMAPDDTVAYHERIIQKLPDPPKRKDRI